MRGPKDLKLGSIGLPYACDPEFLLISSLQSKKVPKPREFADVRSRHDSADQGRLGQCMNFVQVMRRRCLCHQNLQAFSQRAAQDLVGSSTPALVVDRRPFAKNGWCAEIEMGAGRIVGHLSSSLIRTSIWTSLFRRTEGSCPRSSLGSSRRTTRTSIQMVQADRAHSTPPHNPVVRYSTKRAR